MSAHDALPRVEWQALRLACFERDDYTCVECGATDDLQADHIRPLSLYPELGLDLDNLQTLCSPCNKAKSDKDDDAVVRLAWLNPAYPELADLVHRDAANKAPDFSDADQPARSRDTVTHTEDHRGI